MKHDPKEMQDVIDQLRREGRMPTYEEFLAVIKEVRAGYAPIIEKSRKITER